MNPYYRRPRQTITSLIISALFTATLTALMTLTVGCGEQAAIPGYGASDEQPGVGVLREASQLAGVACSAGDSLSVLCGADLSGVTSAVCTSEGTWEISKECASSTSCLDGEIRNIQCGANQQGVQIEVCSLGLWSAHRNCLDLNSLKQLENGPEESLLGANFPEVDTVPNLEGGPESPND